MYGGRSSFPRSFLILQRIIIFQIANFMRSRATVPIPFLRTMVESP